MVRMAYCYGFMALSISLRKCQLFPSTKMGERYPGSPLSSPLALPLAPGPEALSPEAAFHFALQLPLPAPRRATITHTTKRGSGEPPALVAREPGTGGRAGRIRPGGTRGLPAFVCCSGLDGFLFQTSPHFPPPPLFFCCLTGQGDRCVHPPQSPAPISPHRVNVTTRRQPAVERIRPASGPEPVQALT